jgi:hypothetical protein
MVPKGIGTAYAAGTVNISAVAMATVVTGRNTRLFICEPS